MIYAGSDGPLEHRRGASMFRAEQVTEQSTDGNPMDALPVVGAFARGDRKSLARALSWVEEGGAAAREIDRTLWPLAGRTHTIGVTGPPGAGKSTLTGALVQVARSHDEMVAVLAVDPSSPYSGGAILGDRVRMFDHALDPGVYIRSMASRCHPGGLTMATAQAVRVLDAAGAPWVFLETVGVGQGEIEVAGVADTTVVVISPGCGDEVQANQGGLMEIADVFVVNKADQDGVRATERYLNGMLQMSTFPDGWVPPINTTVALDGRGAAELWATVGQHGQVLGESGVLERRRRSRVDAELRSILAQAYQAELGKCLRSPRFQELRARTLGGELDPYSAAAQVLESIERDRCG
jgi:LAO/AO transport system kinase